ncbi:MAG: class SAM-dependent methyltransferase [Bacteroidota bacterium]|nr:class SAM-dependent methyltransferase [Bacteroidota bacterium]
MSAIKKFLLRIYYFSMVGEAATNANQKRIRDTEWDAVQGHIKPGGKFLDVGCGTGYCMLKAKELFNCEVFGIDPAPLAAGVGRYQNDTGLTITKGSAEDIPFGDKLFDTVYCSHVLEHTTDSAKSLEEMSRVMKDDGTLIIGMPTATMASIALVTDIMFTSHFRFVNFFFAPFINTGKIRFIHVFFPPSHSYEDKTVFNDIKNYTVKKWSEKVAASFEIKETLLPLVYPYPEYRQFFKPFKSDKYSSSVFFICKKKK